MNLIYDVKRIALATITPEHPEGINTPAKLKRACPMADGKPLNDETVYGLWNRGHIPGAVRKIGTATIEAITRGLRCEVGDWIKLLPAREAAPRAKVPARRSRKLPMGKKQPASRRPRRAGAGKRMIR